MDLSCVHKALVTFTKTAVKYQQQRFNMQKITMILTHLKTLDNSQYDSYRQKCRVWCMMCPLEQQCVQYVYMWNQGKMWIGISHQLDYFS